MKTIIRATAILGSASVINVLIGIVSAKVMAVLLGPSGFGLSALLQALITFGTMFAGLGVATALVRSGSRALADGQPQYEAALRRAAWLISLIAGLAAALVVIAFRDMLSEFVLGRPGRGYWIALMAPALILGLLNGIQGAALNARQRIADLAKITILSAAVSLLPTISLIWLYGENGVAPALLGNVILGWAVSYAYYRRATRDTGPAIASLPRQDVGRAAGDLLRFGIPYTGSMLVGTGVLILIPVMVLHRLGPDEVGLFRAASAIAVNYLGILLAAMAQDYFPRVSGAPDDPETFNRLINDQLRLVLLIGGPAILAMLGAAPYLIPLLYSHKFDGATDLLEWQLIGDLFKFATWTMSFVIMARLGATAFLLTELAGGLALLTTSWFGMQMWGLPGLGIAFLVTGGFAFALCWSVLWVRIRLTWTRQNAVLFLILASAMALVRLLPALDLTYLRTPVAIVFAGMVGAYSLRVVFQEFGGWNWRSRPVSAPASEP